MSAIAGRGTDGFAEKRHAMIIRLRPEVYNRLQQMADWEGLSYNAIIHDAIDAHFQRIR